MILKRHKSGIPAVLGALASLVLAGFAIHCSGDQTSLGDRADAEPRRGGSAVLGSISDVDSWNEYTSQQSFAGNVLRRIFLRLAQDNGQGPENPANFEPLLARSWEIAEDGRSLTFELPLPSSS